MREELFSQDLTAKFKMKKQDFTRNRKQPFLSTLLFMINLLRKSLAVEIYSFVRHLNDRLSAGVSHFTSSAFIQNRKKINPDVFKHLTSVIIKNFYTSDTVDLKLFRQTFQIFKNSSGFASLKSLGYCTPQVREGRII